MSMRNLMVNWRGYWMEVAGAGRRAVGSPPLRLSLCSPFPASCPHTFDTLQFPAHTGLVGCCSYCSPTLCTPWFLPGSCHLSFFPKEWERMQCRYRLSRKPSWNLQIGQSVLFSLTSLCIVSFITSYTTKVNDLYMVWSPPLLCELLPRAGFVSYLSLYS